jgi:hypothetical protein
MTILRELETEGEASRSADPFVLDELAENLKALGDTAAAADAQKRAAELRQKGGA